jgi:hypothetical protein
MKTTPEEIILMKHSMRDDTGRDVTWKSAITAMKDYAAEVVKEKEEERCRWTDATIECGGMITQNKFIYCPFCGKKIERVKE